MDDYTLTRIDTRAIVTDPGAIFLFTAMRNEVLRLPYFLDYYRKQGVHQFFIIDNGSTDGTLEMLQTQPDCILFRTEDSFVKARGGTVWLNDLLDRYGNGHWCLVVDVDELFVFSTSFGDTFADLVPTLDAEGAQGIFTIMVDMYSDQPMEQVRYRQGTPFAETCPLFDARPYSTKPVREFPHVSVFGGVRQRLFYPETVRRSLLDRIGWKLSALATGLLGNRTPAFITARAFQPSPVISKVPVVKWGPGTAHISCCHTMTPVKLFRARCALLHFKFFDDFFAKAAVEIARKQYANGAREYVRYHRFLKQHPNTAFTGPVSRKYDSPDSLERETIIEGDAESARRNDPTAFTRA